MSVTYYVALPFIQTDECLVPGQPQECQSEGSAIRRAEALAAKPEHAGALAFKRSGDPNLGHFADATVLRTFGIVPDRLDEF
jgi:hypothetical protein